MEFGGRGRAGLVTAPVVAALGALAWIGILHPGLIDPGPPLPWFVAAVVGTGLVGTALLLRAAVVIGTPLCPSWSAAAVAVSAWTVAVVGTILGWPDILTWGFLRVIVTTGLTVSLLTAPGVRRHAREWGLLLLEGWLISGSVFLFVWVLVGLTGSPLAGPPFGLQPALIWLPLDLLAASVTAGLAMRTDRVTWPMATHLTLAALLVAISDLTWVLTGHPQFPVVIWLIMVATLAGTTLIGPLDVWVHTAHSRSRPPQLLRLPQLVVVPGLIFAFVFPADPVLVTGAVSVILALGAELLLGGRQNRSLWSTLRLQAQRLDQVLSESRDALVHIDQRGIVRFANNGLIDVLGLPPAAVLGRNGGFLVHPDDRARLTREIMRLAENETGVGRVVGRFRHAEGGWRSVEATVSRRAGGEPGWTLSARDVSERLLLEQELRRLAATDALTGLANRPAFVGVLQERLAAGSAVVLFIDLDGFKAVNDMDGHTAGDRLLRQVAETLRQEVRPADLAARLGGDEFAVLVGSADVEDARGLADRLVDRLRRLSADPARRTAGSVGIAAGSGLSAEALLGDADLAMYEAKARGGRGQVLFEPWMRERVTERARMCEALARACHGEGLLLDLQPIVRIADGAWVGFESLVRWRDGDRRRPPQEFLPLAEETGLVEPLGRWVLRRSLAWLVTWPDTTAGVAVNVAGAQLATPGFGGWVREQLDEFGVTPSRLTLEISERTSIGDLERAAAVLEPLRAMGVCVALDDFGTGFSSLGHLAELPVDELKIDRRFVAGIGVRAQDDALVRAVCRMAGELGLRVVAEGVETAAQAITLLDRGCRLGQGYRFQPPTPISMLQPTAAWLATDATPPVLPIRGTDPPATARGLATGT
jgi:diguanylate cyclase (GGDEF)-like protein/PAS domain S-box-containing protein